ncbi:MAG: formyltransferase family protein [Planctomycetota bacterium]|nr:formyltransferase family protein [Planctomycetota bacterium]
MSPARLVVLASGGGRTLENLQQRIVDGRLDARIVLVVVPRADLGAAERAQRLGLSLLVIGKRNQPDPERRERLLLQAVLEARPDWVVLAGWLSLFAIPPQLEGRVLNIHPALLPDFGGKGYYGRRVHEAVASSGLAYSGCTVHFADAAYDRGPVVLQSAVLLAMEDDADAIAAKVFAAEIEAFPEALAHLIAGRAQWVDGAVRWTA